MAQFRAPKVYNPKVHNGTRRTMSTRAAERASGSRENSATAANGMTTFRQSLPSTMPQQLALKYASLPAEQRRLEATFMELRENYRNRLRQMGGPVNDVSRAAAYLASVSYSVALDRPNLDETQFAALRAEMSARFTSDTIFRALSDRERQERFEEYGIMASWIGTNYESAKRADDREGLRMWRMMARRNFEALMTVPPERIGFTGSGIVIQ